MLAQQAGEVSQGLRGAVLLGHSLGGTVALRLATLHPEVVSALVLAAPAGITSSTTGSARVIRVMVSLRPGRFVSRR